MLGLDGIRVDEPRAHRVRLGRGAVAPTGPSLLEVVTDPNVPPLPPHITLKQVRHYMKALLHGDPDAARRRRCQRARSLGGAGHARLTARSTRP